MTPKLPFKEVVRVELVTMGPEWMGPSTAWMHLDCGHILVRKKSLNNVKRARCKECWLEERMK
jgi:hypothetical protein